MKTSRSPLDIIDFSVTNFQLNFIEPSKIEDLPDSIEKYDLDIDFGIDKNTEFLQVFIDASINEQRLPGYSIYAEIVCFFKFNTDVKITEEDKKSMEGFSTIYIALNCLRGLISQFTASAPLGRYILPSVDLNDLINKKKLELENIAKEKKCRPKNKSTKRAKR